MAKRVLIAIPIIVIIAAAILYFVLAKRAHDPNTLVVSGNIEVTDACLSFKIPGRLETRLVEEGELVSKDQAIARLENVDQKLLLAQSTANLTYAQAVLAELEAGSRPEQVWQAGAQVEQARAALKQLEAGSRTQEIADAQAGVERAQAAASRAQAQLTLAEADYARSAELFEFGVIPEKQFDTARTGLEAAQRSAEEALAAVKSAEQRLSLVQEGPRIEQIDQAQAVLKQAQATYALVEAGPRAETIEQGRAQVGVAEETVRQAEQQLAYTELRAPFGGTVLSKAAEPGEYLTPGSPVVTIANLDEVWLRAYINETHLSKIKLDQQVEVVTDSYPDKRYQGRISFISSEAEFTPKSVQTHEERVKLMYMVKILLANPDRELKAGMPADATIHLGQ